MSQSCTQMSSTVTDCSPIEYLWDVVEWEISIMEVQLTHLQQPGDAVISIWTRISEKLFQCLIESVLLRNKEVLKAKGVQPFTSNVYLRKWLVSLSQTMNLTMWTFSPQLLFSQINYSNFCNLHHFPGSTIMLTFMVKNELAYYSREFYKLLYT